MNPASPEQKGVLTNRTSRFLRVRWYLRYPLSYRNLEEMMRFAGVNR